MRMRLRQVALVAADIETVERDIEQQLGLKACVRDLGVSEFGLRNVLFPIGDKLLETISPTKDETTAGRLLSKRGGDGGYMVLLQVDDLEAMRKRFDKYGARVIYTAHMPGITGLHLHPRDVGGAILSVDETDDWAAWPWAGSGWRDDVRADIAAEMLGLAIQAGDPAAMAARWAEVLGREVSVAGGEHRIALDEGAIRFTKIADARGEGISALDVRAADGVARSASLCGITVNFVP